MCQQAFVIPDDIICDAPTSVADVLGICAKHRPTLHFQVHHMHHICGSFICQPCPAMCTVMVGANMMGEHMLGRKSHELPPRSSPKMLAGMTRPSYTYSISSDMNSPGALLLRTTALTNVWPAVLLQHATDCKKPLTASCSCHCLLPLIFALYQTQ